MNGGGRMLLMRPGLRAAVLFTSGLLAVIVPIAAGTVVDVWGWGNPEIFLKMFFVRAKALSIFQVVTIATMLSMLFPSAYYGMNILSGAEYENRGWGPDPALSIFLATSLIVLPLMLVFFPGDGELQAGGMSRDECVWPIFILWWTHGAINAIHVRAISRLMNGA